MSGKRGLVLAGILAGAGLGHMPSAAAEAGWTEYGYIQELRPTTAGRFLFRLQVEENPSDCSAEEWFFRDHAGRGAEHISRLLLKRPVRVHVTATCDHEGFSAVNAASLAP